MLPTFPVFDPAMSCSTGVCGPSVATPVHEAAQLQRDQRRAGIGPFAWVVSQSHVPLAVSDPVLIRRRADEGRDHAEVAALAPRVVLVPWSSPESLSRLDLVGPSTGAQVDAEATP